MNYEDKEFVKKCLNKGAIHSPALELGGMYETCRQFLEPAGIELLTTDIEQHPNVTFVADFANNEQIEDVFSNHTFGSVIAISILEHCFEPLRVLDNIVKLTRPGGSIILVVPAIWPLHDFPKDYYRLNPHFYEEYCKRRNLTLRDDLFEYLNDKPVRDYQEGNQYHFPPLSKGIKRLRSRAAHKLFKTDARGVEFSNYVCIGAVIEKPMF